MCGPHPREEAHNPVTGFGGTGNWTAFGPKHFPHG